MHLPYALTAQFNEAVDHLIANVSVDELHMRAQRYLDVFDRTNVQTSPAWAARFHGLN